jgi:phage antirepressor YoqD-like protein
MEQQLVKINNHNLSVKEYKGKRVVTFKEIDECHERPEGTASRNFRENKNRFVEGEDYFFVKPKDIQMDEIRRSEINNSGTYLITESGYMMLVKSLTDELAWQVQRELVNSYFKIQEKPQESIEAFLINPDNMIKILQAFKEEKDKVKELAPKAEYYDTIMRNPGLVTVNSIAQDYGMTAIEMNKLLNLYLIQYKQGEQWILYKPYKDCGYVHSEIVEITHTDGRKGVKPHTKWTQKGRKFIYDTFKSKGILPVIEQQKFFNTKGKSKISKSPQSTLDGIEDFSETYYREY